MIIPYLEKEDITKDSNAKMYSQLWKKHVHGILERPSFLGLLVLVILNQLIKAEQAAQPATGVRVLEVDGDLVHNLRPASGEVVLDDLADADRQLYPDDVGGADHGLDYVVPAMECYDV